MLRPIRKFCFLQFPMEVKPGVKSRLRHPLVPTNEELFAFLFVSTTNCQNHLLDYSPRIGLIVKLMLVLVLFVDDFLTTVFHFPIVNIANAVELLYITLATTIFRGEFNVEQ